MVVVYGYDRVGNKLILCNSVSMNAIYVSQSLSVVVVVAVCRFEISCVSKARRFVS